MVLVFSGFVVVFTDNALGTALIQRRDCATATGRPCSGSAPASASCSTLVGIALAGPLADFYGEPEVRRCSSRSRSASSSARSGTTQMALLVREMQFRQLELRQIAATLVGAAVGITIALAGSARGRSSASCSPRRATSTVAALVC